MKAAGFHVFFIHSEEICKKTYSYYEKYNAYKAVSMCACGINPIIYRTKQKTKKIMGNTAISAESHKKQSFF